MTTPALAILWPALRQLLIRIGRWLLRNIAIEGARNLAVYLRMRARHFAERRATEESKRARARLARRAARRCGVHPVHAALGAGRRQRDPRLAAGAR